MGKKSRKKTAGGGGEWNSGAAATSGGDDFIVEVDNPDGSKAMIGGERTFIGGRTMFTGNAAVPLGTEPFSYDPVVRRRYSGTTFGERQNASMNALRSAFRRKFGDNTVDPMTETCLSLEAKIGIFGYNTKFGQGKGKFTKEEINESLIMSTHRWLITILPMRVIKEVGDMAQVYRKALKKLNHC